MKPMGLIVSVALSVAIWAGQAAADESASELCTWGPIKEGATPQDADNFLGRSITGDWINRGGAGFAKVAGRVVPITQSPTETITIYRGAGGRLFARNQSGSAVIELFPEQNPEWFFDIKSDPIGEGGHSVLSRKRIEALAGCPMSDLPTMIGRGTWVVPGRGELNVTLFFVPISAAALGVVMEGVGTTEGAPFYVRRGYIMEPSFEAVPLTGN